jgi:hypothetical protein
VTTEIDLVTAIFEYLEHDRIDACIRYDVWKEPAAIGG